MKPIHAFLVYLMLICVALVSYDGGKRQVRREIADRQKVVWSKMQGVAITTNLPPGVLITNNVFVDFSGPMQLREHDGVVVLTDPELAYTENVYTNKSGESRSVIESNEGLVIGIRTNRLKAAFEAGFWQGRLRHINASTNELKAAWDEFNRE